MLEKVMFEKRGDICIVTINDPEKLNAKSSQVRNELDEAFDMMERDMEIRVGILTGAGSKAFSVGGDIGGFDLNLKNGRQFLKEVVPKLNKIEMISKPVIAAVNGYALGGGFELALMCDFVIACDKAAFGLPEVNIGMVPPIGILRLQQAVGRFKANELLMLGERISAQEALSLGLVNKVVPQERLMDEAVDVAKKIASKAPLVIEFIKIGLNQKCGGEEFRMLQAAMAMFFASEDLKEGIDAFRNKRAPKFFGY